MRMLILLLIGISPAISLVMTVRFLIRSSKYVQRLNVWKPYVEKLLS